MNKYLMTIYNWSEVWALLIPLFVLFFNKKQPHFLQPVIFYLIIAFIINLLADIIGDFREYLPVWIESNNVLYNVHSIIRFICFSYFFVLLNQSSFRGVKSFLPFIFIVFISANFILAENFFNPDHLSGNLLSAEAYLLLIYCMLFYLAQLREEVEILHRGKDFWVVTGLSIYVTANFFIFLFYVPMIRENPNLAANMWYVHNSVYIILCLSIARSFYVTART